MEGEKWVVSGRWVEGERWVVSGRCVDGRRIVDTGKKVETKSGSREGCGVVMTVLRGGVVLLTKLETDCVEDGRGLSDIGRGPEECNFVDIADVFLGFWTYLFPV